MHQLMRRIEEHKRLEDDWQQSKGKASSRKETKVPEPEVCTGGVNVAFKKSIHKILERIQNEPYIHWLGKMGGDSSRRNQSPYYTYHREKGHTIEECRVFKDYLE